jgi:protein gp37
MAKVSAISWTDATFNPWIGCTKVSPACDHCYAERDNSRRGWVPGWGPGVPRKRTKTWGEPLKWNRKAAETGRPLRVFCASLADVFDNEAPQAWRDDLWQILRQTPNLRWILLTKRIGNAHKMLPPDWPFPNAGLMATLANQEEWNRDIGKLMSTPATWRGVSAEPLLGPIDILAGPMGMGLPDWIITGGESGPGRRPLDMDAVRLLRDQCADLGITFHHKQNGGLRGKDNGCLVDGVEHKHFPPALAA